MSPKGHSKSPKVVKSHTDNAICLENRFEVLAGLEDSGDCLNELVNMCHAPSWSTDKKQACKREKKSVTL